VAAYRGVESKELGIRQDRLRDLAFSPGLRHIVPSERVLLPVQQQVPEASGIAVDRVVGRGSVRRQLGRVRPPGRPPDVLLFVFHGSRREAEVRKVLAHPGMAVAMTTEERATKDLLGPIWLRLVGRRVSLLDAAPAAEAA
jgi:hypothetical protein